MKIDEIILFTNNILNQKRFYTQVLEIEMIHDSPYRVSFKIGKSILTFQYHQEFKPTHFAFNIPSNAVTKAHDWLKDRVTILPFENKPIINFKSWNAKAIYFYDADKNIVEFIARKNLNINSSRKFSSSELLSLSEISIASANIENIYYTLNEMKEIPIFSGEFTSFCAAGNDEGLFILVDIHEKTWFPTMETIYSSDVMVKGDYNFAFINGKIEELS